MLRETKHPRSRPVVRQPQSHTVSDKSLKEEILDLEVSFSIIPALAVLGFVPDGYPVCVWIENQIWTKTPRERSRRCDEKNEGGIAQISLGLI